MYPVDLRREGFNMAEKAFWQLLPHRLAIAMAHTFQSTDLTNQSSC